MSLVTEATHYGGISCDTEIEMAGLKESIEKVYSTAITKAKKARVINISVVRSSVDINERIASTP